MSSRWPPPLGSLFHQELVEWTSGLVLKDIILFSNIFLFLPIPFWLGEKRSSSDSSSSARAEYFSSGSAFGVYIFLLKKDLFFEIDGLRSLGPFVAAGVTVD